MKTKWTSIRLVRLFTRYNLLYFRGRLPRYSVVLSDESYCYRKLHKINMDPDACKNDREVRATLAHEMAHASVGAHGPRFDLEIKRLRSAGAPFLVADFMEGLSEADVIDSITDQAYIPGMTWRVARSQIRLPNHYDPAAYGFLARAKKAYQCARRDYWLNLRAEAAFRDMQAN